MAILLLSLIVALKYTVSKIPKISFLASDGFIFFIALTILIAIGDISIGSSDTPPNNNQPKGTILFNSNPSLGGPMGWVSLGDARWANFGIID